MGLAVAALLVRALWWLYAYGQLPQPFFYEPSDSFMDWFNTAYWAHDKGAYDSWRTIYPPLSFVVIRLLGKAGCYVGAEGLPARDCDWVGLVALHAIFVLNIVLIAMSYLKIDRRTALPRSFALATGMPMMFALERGNILLLCFTAMLLAYGPLLRSTRLRWMFAGAAVNFKVYLIAAIAAQALKRRWLWVEGALLSTVIIYLLSYGILGAGTPREIVTNITDYSSGFIASQVLDIWYSVTYQPLISLLQGETFPTTAVIGSRTVEIGLVVVPLLTLFGQVSVIVGVIATWLRPEVVPAYRVAFFGTVLALISSEAGGYTETMVILFVFMEPWRGIGRPLAILCCYILCLPGDIAIGYIPPIIRDSFLVGHSVEVQFSIGLGMFLRPGLMILIAIFLSATTVRDVWVDIRAQGWKNRWRYRRDWPLLPGIQRPIPVSATSEAALSRHSG
ncbi:hypothetical protein ASG11_03250 [Sphingomonas sp. Leaf357]|uniref:hypothetical protein n=1 Tax=Sphingomonas sp. Leaf357 TaxID=1736350 RepID=UPI0006FD44ED|nr:hypothetical protein [Sphingomonas sp. Leaf357]KQS03396.1 hypothetical protein ASG11_03250 [Sphingomonas sp. Leaf357]